MTNPITTIALLEPQVDVDEAVLARARRRLEIEIDAAPVPTVASEQPLPRSSARAASAGRRRRWLVPVAAVATVGVAAAATWGFVELGASRQSTDVLCQVDTAGKAFTQIRAVTGDPVRDCQTEWRTEHGSTAPAMVAYGNGHGAVTVRLRNAPKPAGSTELPAGRFQQAGTIALSEYLRDIGSGLASECVSTAEAKVRVEAEFTRLGLDDWKAVPDASRPADGTSTCAEGWVDGTSGHSVQLIGVGEATFHLASPTVTAFAKDIQRRLADRCQALDSAEAMVREMASRTTDTVGGKPVNLGDDGIVKITTATDPTAHCTTATTEVGGLISVTLRGPAS